jgi:hypothetical protein
VHLLRTQSAALEQVFPRAHLLQLVPPQSVSDSPPFFTVSVQVGAWHLLPVQTPLVQSAAKRHPLPSPQLAAQEPPQSTSVSKPLRAPSVQVGAWQTLPVQTPLWQSPPD